jgi:hypothetical protein
MNATIPPSATVRHLHCVLGSGSLPYARLAFHSLLANATEPLHLRLITDGEADRAAIDAAMQATPNPAGHQWSVHAQAEVDDLAANGFAGLANLQAFRFGHPCWRKITDPLLMAEPGQELVILDPDLYFPNRFSFEPTPERGILLMWQPPSCLLPDEVVRTAYAAGVPLAHHVDIGVAHARRNIDLDWLDWLIGRLGGKNLPRSMHVEAIVWAALVMREGGGHLPPQHWHCWRNTQWKRLLLKVGVSGQSLLGVDPFDRIKCFHGGGAAKWWVPGLVERGGMPAPVDVTAHLPPVTLEELTAASYDSTQRLKRIARRLGYYRLIGR